LKGVTAINLFLARVPRLSVDMDLNYVGQLEREAMLRERPNVLRAIRQVAEGLRYGIQEGADNHALFKLYLNFRNHMGQDDGIEVEVNFLMRICILPPANQWAVKIADEADCEYPVCRATSSKTGLKVRG